MLDTCLLQERVPFAVVGSNIIIESQGRKVRGRKYPWGVVEGKSDMSVLSCVSLKKVRL